MQNEHGDLMDAFLQCIVVDEGFAGEIADVAEQCARTGNQAVSVALRNIARNHRIRGMEGRAKLAALTAHSAER